jgi:hypothetical protein
VNRRQRRGSALLLSLLLTLPTLPAVLAGDVPLEYAAGRQLVVLLVCYAGVTGLVALVSGYHRASLDDERLSEDERAGASDGSSGRLGGDQGDRRRAAGSSAPSSSS